MENYDYSYLLTGLEKGVLTIKLNLPESLNALTVDMVAELRDAVEKIGRDEAVRAVVITGEGKHFCAGGNIKFLKERYVDGGEHMNVDSVARTSRLVREIKTCPKPFIAMINGAAMGGGTGLALACDFRFMESKSRIGMAFANLGLSGDSAVLYVLSKMIAPAQALQMMLSAEVINGERAAGLGIATLCESGTLAEKTYALANKLAAMATVALGRQKLASFDFLYPDFDSYAAREAENMKICSMTEDFREGIMAFIEKRPSAFKGR